MSELDAKVERLTRALERALERLNAHSTPVAVTKSRAADELDVSVKTIERMCRDGQLKTTLVRGMTRIPFTELMRVAALPVSQRPEMRVEKFNARLEAQAARLARRAR